MFRTELIFSVTVVLGFINMSFSKPVDHLGSEITDASEWFDPTWSQAELIMGPPPMKPGQKINFRSKRSVNDKMKVDEFLSTETQTKFLLSDDLKAIHDQNGRMKAARERVLRGDNFYGKKPEFRPIHDVITDVFSLFKGTGKKVVYQ